MSSKLADIIAARATLEREYAAVLREYLSGGGEAALTRAYAIGREAVRRGLGVVDMVAVHERALRELGLGLVAEDAQLLAESLSPFELTHRGFQEANARLAELNRELRDKNVELERTARELKAAKEATEQANADLESFSYSVSHDLRAPLRAIEGFGQALAEDFSELLGEQGREYLAHVRSSARRMGELIEDLLAFAHVTRAGMHRTSVDLSALARDVLAELRTRDPERQVTTQVQEGLVADADPRLMRVVLENLLGNAWKFTSKMPDARIEVAAEDVDGVRAFVVRDNGAGFDMRFAERLFVPFQRLHTASEFPGTGVGLATVQRVVARHGGRIWAEGEVGRGATFRFTLP